MGTVHIIGKTESCVGLERDWKRRTTAKDACYYQRPGGQP